MISPWFNRIQSNKLTHGGTHSSPLSLAFASNFMALERFQLLREANTHKKKQLNWLGEREREQLDRHPQLHHSPLLSGCSFRKRQPNTVWTTTVNYCTRPRTNVDWDRFSRAHAFRRTPETAWWEAAIPGQLYDANIILCSVLVSLVFFETGALPNSPKRIWRIW